ncbi:MAG: enoyl-CoA hydratase-related protein [Desulforhopalus sp.]
MKNTTLLVEVDHQGVATITLNNPDRHNVFDDAIISAMSAALADLAADDKLRVLVLAASGKTFSGGADLSWMKRMAGYTYEENLADAAKLAAMLKALNFFPRPTIAKVQGPAFGGAVGLVACCDMAVAVPAATFAFTEVKIGLIPATISPYVIAAIGQKAARRYFVTGERINAETAAALGLISEVAEDEQLDARVNELAATVLANSPAAVARAKQVILKVAQRPVDDGVIQYTSQQIAKIRVSEEGQEGLCAFLEKRKPAWSS